MINRIKDTFDCIHASEELKTSTKEYVASLTENFTKNKAAGLSKINFPARSSYIYAFAACILFFICGLGGYSIYRMPVSYISIDLNPSIELSVNRFDRVVDAKGYNSDGNFVLENLDLNHKYYTDAVETLLSSPAFIKYLSGDAALVFTVVSEKEEALTEGIKNCHGYNKYEAQCHSSSADIMDEAHHSNMSVGKYDAYLILSQYDSSITKEQCSNMSMHEIRSLIAGYTKNSGNSTGTEQKTDNCTEDYMNKGHGNRHHGNLD